MSFSSDAKEEICRQRIERPCCATAECYGILLYCHTFAPDLIRITTANSGFAARLPKVFRKAFGVSFDTVPASDSSGKRSLIIHDREKISRIYEAFGQDADSAVAHHVNFAL